MSVQAAYEKYREQLKTMLRGCDLVVGVIGQPNVGKSSLFNVLTGRTEHVGNFPGKTVAMAVGRRRHRGRNICFVDLPGIYGLHASSAEEVVARDFILSGVADVVLVLVDGLNIGRTLYIALQVAQLTGRLVIGVTKWDALHVKGLHVNLDALSSFFKAPVIPVSAFTGEGVDRLVEEVLNVAGREDQPKFRVDLGPLNKYVEQIAALIPGPASWGIAALIVAGDRELAERYGVPLDLVDRVRKEIEENFKVSAEDFVASRLYSLADEIRGKVVVEVTVKPIEGFGLLDKIFSNAALGPLATFLIMFAAVVAAFSVNTGFPFTAIFEQLGMPEIAEKLEEYTLSGLIGSIFNYIGEAIRPGLESVNPLLAGLIVDGIIGGVGTVASFIPLVFITLALMSAIEDSGLGARMAYSVGDLFQRFGLSGRAVYPIFVSMGCNVPGVMASRTSLDFEERIQMALSAPFIPCQARLVVMLFILGLVFRENPAMQFLSIVLLYAGGVALYLITALMIRRFIYRRREPPELILEMPPLHRPSGKVVWWNSWSMTKHFIAKAGTIILVFSAVVWLLLNTGLSRLVEDPSESFGRYVGEAVGLILKPVFGLSDEAAWKIGFAAFNGMIAKENLVVTIVQLTGESEDVLDSLGATPMQALVALIFFAYYIPCMATIATIYSETRNLRLTALAALYEFLLSLIIAALTYRIMALVAG